MAASVIRNINYIKKHFDTHSEFIIQKIKESNISLAGKSTEYVSKIAYPISNYIDFYNKSEYTNLDSLLITDIIDLYNSKIYETKQRFSTKNYIETNTILFDYRKNNVGYYWVDLNTYYSHEMIFRLNNCGRVNSYQNFLELREYDSDNLNHSRIVIVINHSGYINQIRGDYDMKPSIIYRDFIYDLFLNYEKLKGFKFLFTKETDFTHMDLSNDQLNTLKTIRPELFTIL